MWNDLGEIGDYVGVKAMVINCTIPSILVVTNKCLIAISRIQVSKVTNPFHGMATPRSAVGQRKYIYWYEENWSYVTLFGGDDTSSAASALVANGNKKKK